jgi:hypothetical protein
MNAEDRLRNVTSASHAATVATAPPVIGPASGKPHEIKIGKTTIQSPETGKQMEVFTMTLGAETIELLPFRNWGQLDIYKWGVRGKLPGTPAGLEVSLDHVKLAGELVSPKDPDGGARLERIFEEWLAVERTTLELAGRKLHAKPAPLTQGPSTKRGPQPLHFHVEVDKSRQVHVECFQGSERVASIGLTPAGFNSLMNQGLLRKPGRLKVGALHDWVELDGTLCSFEKERNDAGKLEHLLNQQYIPATTLGQGKDIVIFANAASSTGFDIQFPVTVGGVIETRRRHLSEESLELLQDPVKCGLLQPGLQMKLTRPCVVLKQKTPDGGERYLEKSPASLVTVIDDDGAKKVIDLSQPVNYMRLSAVELTAVFNHPAINRHSKHKSVEAVAEPESAKSFKTDPSPGAPCGAEQNGDPLPGASLEGNGAGSSGNSRNSSEELNLQLREPTEAGKLSASNPATIVQAAALRSSDAVVKSSPVQTAASAASCAGLTQGDENRLQPNFWLKPLLAQEPIREDWLTFLLYRRIAQRFGNSREGAFGDHSCWAIALSQIKDITDPGFKGIFLTEKGGLGFLNEGYVARFNRGVAFLGKKESALEGIGLHLLAVGLNSEQRVVFIVDENYRSKFDVTEQTVRQTQERLKEHGAEVMDAQEALESDQPFELLWTVPAQQENPAEPRAVESSGPP